MEFKRGGTFQEKKNIRPTYSAEHIFGGTLLGLCSNDFICFYDWNECRLIRRIDVHAKVCSNMTTTHIFLVFEMRLVDFVIVGCFHFSRMSIGLTVVTYWQLLVIHHFTF